MTSIGLAISPSAPRGGPLGPPSVGSPSFAQMNTAFTNDMGADGFTWAQGGPRSPIVVDQFGKLIAIAENASSNHAIVTSNDGGATWADSLNLAFLTRGSAVYNTIDDRLEVLWVGQFPADGILYRYYTPTRDGSNNITGWTAGGAGYCQLDAQAGTDVMTYMHPAIIWLSDIGAHGTIVLLWSARNDKVGSVGNELRAVMRNLSGTTADLTNTNWTHIGINSTTTIGDAPLSTSYTTILANANTHSPRCAFGRKTTGTHASDLYFVFSTGALAGNAYQFRRGVWAAGSSNWTSLSAATAIATIQRAGTDTGYATKDDLISKVVEDTTADAMLVGLATWKDDTNGDTWGVAQIDGSDAVTLVDTYSAAGAHSYAPTGDIDYDSTTNRLIVSYIKTSTQAAFVQLYNGTTASGSEVATFSSAPVDIPLVRSRAITGKIAILFRDTNATHKGWFGTLTWG